MMRIWLKKLFKILAYTLATLVILMAVAVGIFRLLLPRAPEYQEEIKAWANAAIGMQVEFTDMDARWRLSGPELTFQNAKLTSYEATHSLVTVGEVSVSVSLWRLLSDLELVVDQIALRGAHLSVQHSKHDGWLLQGIPIAEVIGTRERSVPESGHVLIVAQDIELEFLLPDSSDSVLLALQTLEVRRDDLKLDIEADLRLPETLGNRMSVSVTQHQSEQESGIWDFFVEARDLQVAGWPALASFELPPIVAGVLDLSASLQVSSDGIEHATADFALDNLEGGHFDLLGAIGANGRIEYSKDTEGWLIAASKFVFSSAGGDWPQTSLSLQISEPIKGEIRGITATAGYLNLDDSRYIAGWLPVKYRDQLTDLDAGGQLLNLRVTLGDLHQENIRFDVSSEMLEVGIAATESLPGLRGLSGLVRADNSGGRLEVEANDLVVDARSLFDEEIEFDDAIGTVIWRRNSQGITILSDSIRIRNADLDSQSSLQVILPPDGAAPVVDIESEWSVNDVAAAKRYLPAKLIKPKLYEWLTMALVEGRATRGSLKLTGSLDQFPFDNGEGVFRIDAHLEDTTLRYSPMWPAARNMTLDVVVDGMRLYSTRNTANNAGNTVSDARIEIADLRRPLLTIDAFATGSLQSIHDFSSQSPIGAIFGGHLARVSVGGEASFSLKLNYPIFDKTSYTFETRIQASNGSLALEGFPAQLTELNGIINVSRDDVSSESLFARFLGEQVDIELTDVEDPDSPYSIFANLNGRLSAIGLVQELAPALENIINGSATYQATAKFPRGEIENPQPFAIDVRTDLMGIGIELPEPLAKLPPTPQMFEFEISFPEPGRITSTGQLAEELKWQSLFVNDNELGWDFNRGTLSVGGAAASIPELRGLHIVGNTDDVVLEDWLGLARNSTGNSGIADRIRFIDLDVANFSAIGQDLHDHNIQVQRSAEDWIVNIDGEHVSGTLSVPYDFASGRSLRVEMERLILPGRDETDELQDAPIEDGDSALDPRTLPPLLVTAQEFGLGKRRFGEVLAEFALTERGLESTALTTTDDTFTIEGIAGWVIDADFPQGQRTFINADLTSMNVRRTMTRLDYQPGISSKDMVINLDVSWPGGPGEDFLQELSGNVAVRIGVGQLQDVEPGAGRVFGLMSIVALPRRLSLDFGDVFDKGYGFDSIDGNFRIEDGQAYTCDLSVIGPAADVGIVGRAGLATRDYDQTVVVSANVGNTLPVVGAIVGGPPVGAALFFFSQLFKKPLQNMGQKYYDIAGSWDEPAVELSDASAFEANSERSQCAVDDSL